MGTMVNIPNEGSIDLDLVEGKTSQVAKRRVAGAEIVQRNPHSQFAQLMQHGNCLDATLQQNCFGDLKLEATGRQTSARNRGKHGRNQVLVAKLDRRKVDGHLEIGWP